MFKSIFREISHLLRYTDIDMSCSYKSVGVNNNGDITKKIDQDCESIFIKHLKKNKLNIIGYISEETESIIFMEDVVTHQGEDVFIVAFDPLDGSDNYISNINTGSIYGVYRYDSNKNSLLDIVESGYCLYGIKSIMVQTKDNSVLMSYLTDNGLFHDNTTIHFDLIEKRKKIYSINASREYVPEIRFILNQYKSKKYNTRWVGTLVADAHRILLNDGIFYYPSRDEKPSGKIRMLYESIPMAYIFKLAGGVGLCSYSMNILDRINTIDLNNPHICSPIILASNKEHSHLLEILENYELNKH